MRLGIITLQTKANFRQVLFGHDWLRCCEPIILQHHVKFVLLALTQQRVKPAPHAVFWDYRKTQRSLLPIAAKAEAAEHRIVRQDCRGSSQRAAVTEIYFAGVIPRAAMMRLIKPCLAIRGGLEPAAGATVIFLAGIPVAVVRFGRAAVLEGPGAQI